MQARILFPLLTIAVALIGCDSSLSASVTSSSNVESVGEVEYEVSSILIELRYAEQRISRIVIREETLVFEISEPETIERLGVGSDIIVDFNAKNQYTYFLSEQFILSKEYVLISQQEIEDAFSDSGGWSSFYESYPKSQGIMTLSRVGLNSKKDRALVVVANQSHGRAGEGVLVLLGKDKGTWMILKELLLWLS